MAEGQVLEPGGALCDLSFNCQSLVLFSLGEGEAAERLRAGGNMVGLLEGGEPGREAGRIGEGSRRREGAFESSFTSPQRFPTDPAGHRQVWG